MVQLQPSARPVYLSAWKQCSTCSSGRACHAHACCACPSAVPLVCWLCPKGQRLPYDPSPPSQLCRRCGGCSAASHVLRLSLCAYGARQAAPLHACRRPLTSESAAVTLRRFICNYHFSILQITGSLSLSWRSERCSWRGAVFLDGERAFDCPLHERLVLLEAAAFVQTNVLSRCRHPRGPSIHATGNSAHKLPATPTVPGALSLLAVPER